MPLDHVSFTNDLQVNFSSLSTGPAGDISALPSTVQIVNLELHDPPTDNETTTITMTKTKTVTTDMTDQVTTKPSADSLPCQDAASLPCLQADTLPCLQAAGLPCATAADEACVRNSVAIGGRECEDDCASTQFA